MATPEGMRKRKYDPRKLRIPDVRITSFWDEELLDMFRSSVDAMGIQEPILCAWDGTDMWVIDGKNRRDEAISKGIPQVDIVYIQGDQKDILLRNLILNRLRGKTKASEMVLVVKELKEKHGLGLREIVNRTGLKEEYLKELMSIAGAAPDVWRELDLERIGVGHAFQISRVKDEGVQARLLMQTKQFSLTVPDLKDVVEEVLSLMVRKDVEPEKPQPKPTDMMRKVTCHTCEREWPVKRVTGMNVCITCYGWIMDMARKYQAELLSYQTEAQQQAQQLVTDPTESTGAAPPGSGGSSTSGEPPVETLPNERPNSRASTGIPGEKAGGDQ